MVLQLHFGRMQHAVINRPRQVFSNLAFIINQPCNNLTSGLRNFNILSLYVQLYAWTDVS